MNMGKFFTEASERLQRLVDAPTPSVWDLLDRENLLKVENSLECDIERWIYYSNSDDKKAQESFDKLVAVRKLLGR